MNSNRTAGFSFIELMVAIGVFAIVASAMAYLNLSVQKGQIRNASGFQLQIQQRNFATLINHPKAWANTLNASANAQAMRCLKARTPCTVNGQPNGQPLQNVPFALADGSGDIVFDATVATQGFTLAGSSCNTYSSRGDAQCPIRFDLKWSAECTPGDCVNPLVKIEAPLEFATQKFPLNPAHYSLPPIFRSME